MSIKGNKQALYYGGENSYLHYFKQKLELNFLRVHEHVDVMYNDLITD